MAPTTVGPLILLSPAKSLNFDGALSPALGSLSPTQPRCPDQTAALTSELGKLDVKRVKSLFGLSDALATLNHARFADFEQQQARAALGAFEGQAYKGLDAASLSVDELTYLQRSLRILCGLYGVLRPLDEIRPYRLEMSTKLACGVASNLYDYWGADITELLNQDIGAARNPFVLNVASAEYAKAVRLPQLSVPVVTASFPGPAVYAKMARGAMVRFCAERQVAKPSELCEFTGRDGEWRYVPSQSTDEVFVFQRGAPAAKAKPAKVGESNLHKTARAGADTDAALPSAKRRRAKK
jgi:cytoplasmic iron level regulating protein YaaA (DUF328/UPF0246 family)